MAPSNYTETLSNRKAGQTNLAALALDEILAIGAFIYLYNR